MALPVFSILPLRLCLVPVKIRRVGTEYRWKCIVLLHFSAPALLIWSLTAETVKACRPSLCDKTSDLSWPPCSILARSVITSVIGLAEFGSVTNQESRRWCRQPELLRAVEPLHIWGIYNITALSTTRDKGRSILGEGRHHWLSN